LYALVKTAFKFWAVGTRCNVTEEVFAYHFIRVTAGNITFCRFVLNNFTLPVELNRTESNVINFTSY